MDPFHPLPLSPEESEQLPCLDEAEVPRLLRRWAVSVLVLVAAHLPLVLPMFLWMWGRKHYQFFPLVLAGFGILVVRRLKNHRWPPCQVVTVRHALLAVTGILLFLTATVANSRLTGLLSLIFSLWGTTWFFGGPTTAERLRPAFGFLALIIPLPLNLDLELILWLQARAAQIGSIVLDSLGLEHSLSGVVITTVQRPYLVEETCSGIHSLFAVLTVVLFSCVWAERRFVRSLLLLLCSAGWILLANGLRISLIVSGQEQLGLPLGDGWPHELLGALTYVVALGLTASTERGLEFLVPESGGLVTELRTEFFHRVVLPQLLLQRSLLDEVCITRHQLLRMSLVTLSCLLVTGSTVAAVRQFAVLRPQAENVAVLSEAGNLWAAIRSDVLPAKFGRWSLADFEKKIRPENDRLAKNSAIWTFHCAELDLQFSIDGDYAGWHDLAWCYQGTGWQLDSEENVLTAHDGTGLPCRRILMTEEARIQSVVLFVCVDSRLQPVAPAPVTENAVAEAVRNRLQAFRLLTLPEQPLVAGPCVQFQLLCHAGRTLTVEEHAELMQLFHRLCQRSLQYFGESE